MILHLQGNTARGTIPAASSTAGTSGGGGGDSRSGGEKQSPRPAAAVRFDLPSFPGVADCGCECIRRAEARGAPALRRGVEVVSGRQLLRL